MPNIAYSTNWNNKLACPVHTTFRIYDTRKFFVGAQHQEMLKGKVINNVEVIQVIPKKLNEVTNLEALLDTGYKLAPFKKVVETMYKSKFPDVNRVQFCLVVLKITSSQHKLQL